ncbi:helix-turn-helix transcriptional regulator [Thermoanaerobacterium sp. DL9XJH110]|uniref:helix-turn-helix transcriptional regulator n=1 Tax=Thermoanaerobacterium sp. DL9XJH110 TaxID=3386643 RepID=UPI003BB6DA76
MNTLKLKGARVAKGYTQETLAQKLHMSAKTYNRKELGLIEFNRHEILTIAQILELNTNQVNEIFFDNKLTNCIRTDHPAAAEG